MHPGFHGWWQRKCAQMVDEVREGHERHGERHDRAGCGARAGRGEHGERGHGWHAHGWHGGGGGDGGGLGVRRPLRFLAQRLELRDDQVAELARILNNLKTERAQGEVDQQRTLTSFADSVERDAFDTGAAQKAGESRLASAARLGDAVVRALGEIHVLLDAEQRKQFAYLLRTGALSM